MAAFYNGTNWYTWGVYLGGVSYSCPTDRLTAGWIRTEVQRGWRLIFIWVGYQASCSGYQHRMSSDPDVAREQGFNAASNAYLKAQNLELNLNLLPITYDLENFDTGNEVCLRAAKAYIRGWIAYFHAGSTEQRGGLYGSASDIDEFFDMANRPDYIWAANWSSGPNTNNIDYIPDSHWSTNNRHKQYIGPHNVTENGVTLEVDTNCSNGPAYGQDSTSTADPDCI